MNRRAPVLSALALSAVALASVHAAPVQAASLTRDDFGRLADGTPVERYTMTAAGGVSVAFISYGGTITDVVTPDRAGRPGHIVLGFSSAREYETKSAEGELYFGAILGRFANWIDRGRFSLDGHAYQITLSNPPHTIHGGRRGFDKRIWTVEPMADAGPAVSARLSYVSADGEEGFPGRLDASVTYTLSDDGVLTLDHAAVTDRPTVVNMSSHMNFNLAGAGASDVLRQVLTIAAGSYLPLDRSQMPLGPTAPVAGTPFDFRTPTAIGAHIHDADAQLAIADGYDQYWVLDPRGENQPAVHAFDPGSGRTIDCLTTEPGVQIYTADWFDGSIAGIGGRYGKYAAFTLETQHYPDSPNHPDYPSTVLRPGETYRSTTQFRFGVKP